MAQHEREMISERTRAALQAAKARGKVLGNPRLREASARDVDALKAGADRFAANVLPLIREIQASGITSANAIAHRLNDRGVMTARGGKWTHVQVDAATQQQESYCTMIEAQVRFAPPPQLTDATRRLVVVLDQHLHHAGRQ